MIFANQTALVGALSEDVKLCIANYSSPDPTRVTELVNSLLNKKPGDLRVVKGSIQQEAREVDTRFYCKHLY